MAARPAPPAAGRTAGRAIDPVTFEVIWHRILDIAEEMGIKYMRTSGSPVLVGAYDASTGITLPDGELVAMGPYITTQAHVLRLIVASVIAKRSAAPGIRAGDMFICNDPYLGATHQPDVATVAPVFHDGALRAWVGSSGHWLDIGGPEPGGFNMNAVSVFDEGLRLPPTRLVDAGVIREDLVELIMAQVREPLAELDLRGQVVANRSGAERLAGLFDAYGPDTVTAVMREGIDHVERRLRSRLASLPDGVWREVQYLDHDGHRPAVRQIVCTLTKRGDSLTIDFSGSAAQTAGFANCARGGLRAAALSAVCIVLGYDLSWNDGVARCVRLIAPPRSVVTAEFPAPVSMSTISAIIVTLNLVFGTLCRMLLASPPHHDEVMANWCGTSIGVSIMGRNDRGQYTVAPEASHFAAGCGARSYADGVDTGGIIINTTANIPSIEATEAEYPLLYLFRRQLADSGGAGRFRGGMSAGVALVPHDAGGPLETSFSGVGAELPNGFGLAGGLPGAAARFIRFRQTGVPGLLGAGQRLPADVADLPGTAEMTSINTSHGPFPADSVEYHNWQGGGGYGDPLDRDPQRVLADIIDERVSVACARQLYGVVVTGPAASGGGVVTPPSRPGGGVVTPTSGPSGTVDVDLAATGQARHQERQRRLSEGRPARELLPEPSAEWRDLTRWVTEQHASGTLRIGDSILLDFDADRVSCAACGVTLGDSRGDPRGGCLAELTGTGAAGPVRGQDYGSENVVLARYYCAGCGRQLDASVLYRDLSRHHGYLPAAAIAGPPGAEAGR
jgi:N-methylhydantoinase B